MGLKLMIILFAILVLTIFGALGFEVIMDKILPNSQGIIGHGCCIIGGFMANPMVDIFGMNIPFPIIDDFILGFFVAIPLTVYFMRGSSLKKAAGVMVLIAAVFIIIYKAIGMVLVNIAESVYGMENCFTEVSIPGLFTFSYEWYSMLFTIGLGLVIFAVLGAFIVLKSRR